MVYELDLAPHVDRRFMRLSKKNRSQLVVIYKKIQQILENPYHFKPLRGDMHGSRRVHVESSFVLVYEIDEPRKTVKVLDYDHHDKIFE